MNIPEPELTPEQAAAVEQLVREGYAREAAIVLVLESTEDVIE